MHRKTILGLAGLFALLATAAPVAAQVTTGDCCTKPVGAHTGKTTSTKRIPVTKEPEPQVIVKHVHDTTFVPSYITMPPDTVTKTVDHYFQVKPKHPGCWSTGKCELITLGAIALGYAGYECATDWCKSHGTDIDVEQHHVVVVNGLRRPMISVPLVFGFGH